MKLSLTTARKYVRGVKVQLHVLLTSPLNGGERSTASLQPTRLTPRKGPPVSINWADSRTCWDVFRTMTGNEPLFVQPDYVLSVPYHFNGNCIAILPCMLNRLSGTILSGFPPKTHLHAFLQQSSRAVKTKWVSVCVCVCDVTPIQQKIQKCLLLLYLTTHIIQQRIIRQWITN